MIVDVINFYGASDKVRESDIQNLVSRILSNYWWMKLEELAYVFNKGKEGHYGKIFGIISPKVISDWIKEYDLNERDMQIVDVNQTLNDSNTKQILSDEQLKEFYKNPDTSTTPPPDGSERMNERDDTNYASEKAEYFRKRHNPDQ